MTKKSIKFYISNEARKNLLKKAQELGFDRISPFLEHLAFQDFCLLDTNLKKVLRNLELK